MMMMEGCLEAMAEAGLETPADWIKYGDFSFEPSTYHSEFTSSRFRVRVCKTLDSFNSW